MTTKKGKAKEPKTVVNGEGVNIGAISNKGDLKTFLVSIRDRMTDGSVAPIYAMTAMNSLLTMSEIYDLLDNENKEVARDIWLRLKQNGLQVRTPPILFGEEETTSGAGV